MYHLDNGIVFATDDIWYKVFPPVVINDYVMVYLPKWKMKSHDLERWAIWWNLLFGIWLKMGPMLHPTYMFCGMTSITLDRFLIIHTLWIGMGSKYLPGIHSQLWECMWRCVLYVCICYILVLFVNGGWYMCCNDTQLLFTRHIIFHLYSYFLPIYTILPIYFLFILYLVERLRNYEFWKLKYKIGCLFK